MKKIFKKLFVSILIGSGLIVSTSLKAYATPSSIYQCSNNTMKYGFDNKNNGKLWITTSAGNQIFYGDDKSSTFPYLIVDGTYTTISDFSSTISRISTTETIKTNSEINGIASSMKLTSVNANTYAKYEITVTNTSNVGKNVGYKEYWDTCVNGNDKSPIQYLESGNGFRMYSGSVQLTMLGKNTPNVTDTDKMWAGTYGTGKGASDANMTISPGGTFSAGDSALFFRWDPTYLAPGASRTYSIIVGAGDVNNFPNLSLNTPANGSSYVYGNSLSITGVVSDKDVNDMITVYYSLDGVQGTLGTLTATGSNQSFSYSKLIPTNYASGTHTLKVWAQDQKGGVSSEITRTFNYKRDVTPPNATHSLSPNGWTNGSVNININATDDISGVSYIQMNGGNKVNSANASFAVNQNGTYLFTLADKEGNSKTYTVNVTNIDKIVPIYTRAEIVNKDKYGYDVYIYGVNDSGGSNINRVQFPTWTSKNGQDDLDTNWGNSTTSRGTNLGNGTWKFHVNTADHNTEYGEYITHIYVYDNAGNYSMIGVNVIIDNTPPTLDLSIDYDLYTTDPVTITAIGTDECTGVHRIVKPDGNIVYGDIATFVVKKNGIYIFKCYDEANNETIKSIEIKNIIDVESCSGLKNVEYKLTGDTVTSGWVKYNGTFGILNEGITNIEARAFDNAGNVAYDNSVVKIDRTKPINGTIEINTTIK